MGRRIWAALLCGLLLCAPALAIGPVSGEQMRGMDVSVYQGNVDFAAAKADGIETVYIRAGYGETGVDAYYRQHYEGASAAGLKVGFYHYMDAVTEEGARRQAAHFAALIRDLPADCRPVMDFETFGGMDREEAGAVGLAFLEAVEETAQNAGSYVTLLLGNHGGVLGETCAITLLIGGIYLIWTKVISPTIPVTYLATVAVFSLLCGYDPIYQLLSGGLILGAFFMATDYVTSPTTEKGKLVFGIGLGVITCLIRFFGTMNEGVSFAILLMNLLVPYIEVLTRQDLLGISKPKKNKGGAAK